MSTESTVNWRLPFLFLHDKTEEILLNWGQFIRNSKNGCTYFDTVLCMDTKTGTKESQVGEPELRGSETDPGIRVSLRRYSFIQNWIPWICNKCYPFVFIPLTVKCDSLRYFNTEITIFSMYSEVTFLQCYGSFFIPVVFFTKICLIFIHQIFNGIKFILFLFVI